MKHIFITIKLCALLFICSNLSGQRFSCDGQLLIAINDGISTQIQRPVYIPFSTPFLSPFIGYFNSRFDALGFNSKDNYIYGVQENTNAIVRLKSDSTFDTIGIVPIVDTLKVMSGDCSVDGLYLCYEEKLNQILVFDVVDNFELLRRIDLYWNPESPNSRPFMTSIFDFAFDPNNPLVAYAYQGTSDHIDLLPEPTRGYLLEINLNFDDPNLGMVSPITQVDTDQVSHIGGLIFDPTGGLYGFGTSDTGLNPIQNKLFSINRSMGNVDSVLKNPKAQLSDGCSCPFSFTFSNRVPIEGMFCSGDLKTFVLTISNFSFNSVDDITLIDTLPEGMIVEKVTGVLLDNLSSINGIGTSILEIKGLDIPAKNTTTIEIKVSSIDAISGSTYNQAFLHDLPERFDEFIPSDDISTSTVKDDASLFIVVPLSLEDVTYEVKKPTDCINANDGQIRIFSPQFIQDQEYEILVRNRMGWEDITFNLIADQDNSLLLDSLKPGEYRFVQLRNMNENCGLAIREFFIDVEPPNNDIDLTISSESPICEGEQLALFSSSQNATSIRWKGPKLYSSEVSNPIIENANPDNSGMYYIATEYGYCNKYDTLEVIVKPLVNTSISGDSIYCERDQLLLTATGNGDDIIHNWSGPNNMSSGKSSLITNQITDMAEGYYEVISSNGACTDTAGVYITIQPTPSIVLQDEIITDFCNAQILEPLIVGEDNVTYNWVPSVGLSCDDCPNPQLEPIVQSQYKAVVENSYFCKDSAEISVVLDTDKLIYIPNVINADANGDNGKFGLFPGCAILKIDNLTIYDRWGQVVFVSDSISIEEVSSSWNGFINGKVGNSGVYIWAAEVELVDGSSESLQGNVTLLRGK